MLSAPQRLKGAGEVGLEADDALGRGQEMPGYLREYDIITQGERSKIYVKGQHCRSQLHLAPFFGNMGVSES